MKKVFEKIYEIFDHIVQLHAESPHTIRKLMKEFKQEIDDLDDDVDLSESEKEFLKAVKLTRKKMDKER